MKKIIYLVISIVMMMSICITVNAAGSGTLNGNTSVTVGNNIEFTVSVSGCGDATSIAVAVTYGNGFELVSGSWLKSGSITKFDTETNKGALGGLSSPDVNGNLFKVVLKAKTASASAQNVSVNVIAKNGSNEIMNITPSKSVKINCETHSYSAWSNNNTTNHIHTCSACGNSETQNHTWNSGEIIKQASCKEAGEKKFTCTTCNATKTEPIAKTSNHSYGSWNVTKEATCTTAGTQTRTCSVCSKTETSSINAKGHSFGSWSQTTAPTCTTAGLQKRTCTRSGCSYSETKSIAALGHSFSNPTVTKQPTCTETGIETGTCTRCNQKTTNTVKATGHRFGKWTDVTAATCTTTGQSERACSNCTQKETKTIDALGHDFENPTIVKEATLTSTGLMEGKCKRCNEATQEIIPCKAVDTTTGVSIEAEIGIFEEGTTLNFSLITKDDGNYESVKTAVADKGTKFVAYNVRYTKDGTEINPNGEYTLIFPNANKRKAEEIIVMYISEDGTVTEKEFTLNEDETISVKAKEAGTYVVIDKISTESEDVKTNTNVEKEQNKDNKESWSVMAVVAAIVVVGVVIAIIITKRKKNTDAKTQE